MSDSASSMRTLIVPGLGDSGPSHWQSLWENSHPGFRRIRQRNWESPQIEAWSIRIRGEIETEDESPVLVAHSFGCLASARCAISLGRRIAGILMVAPADPAKYRVEERLPKYALPFPCTLVASRNDPWFKFEHAKIWADRWGADFVDAGEVGHINVQSGFGPWPLGEQLLEQLYQKISKQSRITNKRRA